MGKIEEMTGVSAIPAIGGMGLGYQPRPKKKLARKRTAVESLLDDAPEVDDPAMEPVSDLPELPDKAERQNRFDVSKTVAVIRDGDSEHPSEVLALEVEPDYAKWRVLDNNRTFSPARVASNEEARKILGDLIGTLEEPSAPAAPTAPAATAVPESKAPVNESRSLRDYYSPGESKSAFSPGSFEKLDEKLVEKMASSIASQDSALPIVDASGIGESLMRGGAVPPPDAVPDPHKLTKSVHQYLA